MYFLVKFLNIDRKSIILKEEKEIEIKEFMKIKVLYIMFLNYFIFFVIFYMWLYLRLVIYV